MLKYKFVDRITSDVMFEAYGADFKQLLENAAEALSKVICKIDKVAPKKTVKITASGNDEKDLLFNWLQQIIAAVDTNEMFFSKFKITKLEKNKLEAEISGEEMTPEKGETVVKAVTYFNYKLEKDKKGYKATVALDI